tara:strand:+ start:594 stop:1457 length:864 start_codon:yes stop_codon:yes gene_type:complete
MADYQTYKKINGGDAVLGNSLGPAQVSGFSTAVTEQMVFWHDDFWSHNNGGCCCGWTVPGKVLSIKFELRGGGGSGGPARCCQTARGTPGGSGAYSSVLLHSHKGDFTPGSSTYTICSGGSNQCSCCGCCHGRTGCSWHGCPSWVTGPGLSSFCAVGGTYGHQRCGGWCYNCMYMKQCNTCYGECNPCGFGGTKGQEGFVFLKGISSMEQSNYYCFTEHYMTAAGGAGPWASPMSKSRSFCTNGNIRGCCFGHSLFPGGGGMAGSVDGSQCWGDWGQGGMVVVTTWS